MYIYIYIYIYIYCGGHKGLTKIRTRLTFNLPLFSSF